VCRGHRLDSRFAPKSGYRYDGLYRVESYWGEKGRDGFQVYRFRLERLPGQAKIGDLEQVDTSPAVSLLDAGNQSPQREIAMISRIIRSTMVGNQIKRLYDYTCQFCGVRLVTPAGPYAESCHIRPLGKPHNGPDTMDNVLCLCPTCHVLFDARAITLSDEMEALPKMGRIRTHPQHPPSLEHNLLVWVDKQPALRELLTD
jgi:putative restriction endonuclease